MNPIDVLMPNEDVLASAGGGRWADVVAAFTDPADVGAQITAVVGVTQRRSGAPAGRMDDIGGVVESPVGVWAVWHLAKWEVLEVSRVGLYRAVSTELVSQEAGDDVVALDRWARAEALYWKLSEPLTAIDYAESALEITGRHQWGGADFDLACLVLDAAVESLGSAASEKAQRLLRKWQDRLISAVRSEDPDVAYTALQQLHVWEDIN